MKEGYLRQRRGRDRGEIPKTVQHNARISVRRESAVIQKVRVMRKDATFETESLRNTSNLIFCANVPRRPGSPRPHCTKTVASLSARERITGNQLLRSKSGLVSRKNSPQRYARSCMHPERSTLQTRPYHPR